MSKDVIALPTGPGLEHRRAQIERDRLRLLAQMEREEIASDPSPIVARRHRITVRTVPRLTRPA